MEIIKFTKENQKSCLNLAKLELSKGNLIIYPTETCYGIGADATNQLAVNKLLKFKSRREGKAFSIAVYNESMAKQYVSINSTAKNLYKNFLPGPLTIISNINRKNKTLAKGVKSEFNTVGIRIPDYEFTLQLTKKFKKPITATSANVSYQSPPYSFTQWKKQTPSKSQKLITLWIDAGKLPTRNPSTVIDTTVDELTILRQGNIIINNADYESVTNSEKETHKLATQILKRQYLNNHCIIFALQGPLGAGKTQFTKGLAKSLNITNNIKSPTYTLVNEYQIPKRTNNYLYHIDTWRMENTKELFDINFQKMLKTGNVIVIEWADKVYQEINEVLSKSKIKKTIMWGNIKIISTNKRQWEFSNRLE